MTAVPPDVEIGFRIQQTLLLDEPPRHVPGIAVGALTIPSAQVDGDFYDFLEHEDQCLDVILGDVMGKGVAAALLAAATKSRVLEALCYLLSMSHGAGLPKPKDIVTLAHAGMAQQLMQLESFVTCCYARFDLNRRTLEFVDCGHTGVLHFSRDTGECRVLHGDNLPLGVHAGEIYDQVTEPFAIGDVFVFYSDGITEATDPARELFGIERLVACVRANGRLEPQPLVGAVRDAVQAFSGPRPSDDQTCVAIRIVARQVPLGRADLEITSRLDDLRRAREFVRAICAKVSPAPLDAESVAALELAVDEVASNIMIHAYHRRPDQWIRLEAEAFADRVSIRLHHLGDSFAPSAPPPAPSHRPQEGYGLYLISKSVDDVQYYRDDRGRNCIALTKRRGL